MSKIVSLDDFRKQIESEKDETLDQLLKKARVLREKGLSKKDVKSFSDLKKAFEIQLNTFLLERRLIGSDVFLCASYIAGLLSDIGWEIPESFYATDYIIQSTENGNDLALKKGGDACFALCSLFPQRCERRWMKREDYVDMGISMYNSYYYKTGREVMYHMAKHFKLMSEATTNAVQRI